MNRLLLLLLGLILLGLLAFFCVRNHAPAIEEDLSTRASTALNDMGLNWVQSSIVGRELKLTGIAPNARSREQAVEVASAIQGISGVDNQITIVGEKSATTPSAGEYQTQFTLTDNKVILKGMVPDQKTHDLLVGIASQRFGTRNIKDQLNIQSAAPSGWKQAAEVALTQLNSLDKGSAQIINNKMHITGSTSNVRTRIQIQSAIKNALPSDYQASFDIAVSDLAAAQSTTQQLSPAATFCQKQFDTLLDNGQHILFKVDSDIINTQSNRLLNQLVKAANDCSRARIEISGHTDSQGSKAYNKQLSTRRAQAVIRYLTAHGISRNRLSAVGNGESSPIANNRSIEGRAKNRRIQFKVIGN